MRAFHATCPSANWLMFQFSSIGIRALDRTHDRHVCNDRIVVACQARNVAIGCGTPARNASALFTVSVLARAHSRTHTRTHTTTMRTHFVQPQRSHWVKHAHHQRHPHAVYKLTVDRICLRRWCKPKRAAESKYSDDDGDCDEWEAKNSPLSIVRCVCVCVWVTKRLSLSQHRSTALLRTSRVAHELRSVSTKAKVLTHTVRFFCFAHRRFTCFFWRKSIDKSLIFGIANRKN